MATSGNAVPVGSDLSPATETRRRVRSTKTDSSLIATGLPVIIVTSSSIDLSTLYFPSSAIGRGHTKNILYISDSPLLEWIQYFFVSIDPTCSPRKNKIRMHTILGDRSKSENQ